MDSQKKVFFSVIITSYNRVDKILTAIESVIKQSYKNFEVIIVNDGSTQDYTEIQRYCEDSKYHLRYFKKENEERSIARNYAFEKVRGKWVCFLDDDDIYYPNHLEVFKNEIEKVKDDNVFYHTRTVKRHPDGRKEKMKFTLEDFQGGDKLIHDLFTIHSVCFSSKLVKENKFDPRFNFWEDFEYWLRLSDQVTFFPINVYTHEYILHGNNSVVWSVESRSRKLETLLYIQKAHKDKISSVFLNNMIADLLKTVCESQVRNGDNESFKASYFLLLKNTPSFLFTRRTLGLWIIYIKNMLK